MPAENTLKVSSNNNYRTVALNLPNLKGKYEYLGGNTEAVHMVYNVENNFIETHRIFEVMLSEPRKQEKEQRRKIERLHTYEFGNRVTGVIEQVVFVLECGHRGISERHAQGHSRGAVEGLARVHGPLLRVVHEREAPTSLRV
ncbi:hypothetical protein MRX96_040034 [Rhipicephalus microplus]